MTLYLRVLAVLWLWQSSKESFILACGPNQGTMPSPRMKVQRTTTPSAQSRLDEIIRNAYKSINVDKISLDFSADPVETTGDTVTATSKTVVKRPNLGQTVSFICETASENASATVIWTHQGSKVAQNGHLRPRNSADHQYSVSFQGSGTILSIINVSFASSGAVICYEKLYTTATIVKRYSLHPNVSRAADVFTEPMPRWSVEARSNRMQKIWCKVHLPLPPKMVANGAEDELFIWRHNNRTVLAPRKHPYTMDVRSTSRRGLFFLSGHFYNTTASTLCFWMILDGLTTDDSGSVECWFRATPDIHEWHIQSATLNVYRVGYDAPDGMDDYR